MGKPKKIKRVKHFVFGTDIAAKRVLYIEEGKKRLRWKGEDGNYYRPQLLEVRYV